MTIEEIQKRYVNGSINVSQLLKEPIGTSCNYDIAEIINEQASGSIQGKITLIHTGQGILIQGKLSAKLELTCSRCLNTFVYPMSFSMEEEFLSTANVPSGSPSSLPEGFTIDDDHLLDLGELICQYILLNLPMKPLCQPNCVGVMR
jgi:uncharacterized protein